MLLVCNAIPMALTKDMKFAIGLVILFLTVTCEVQSQEDRQHVTGQVTFLTTSNIYVRFDDTTPIKIGDSLKISPGGIACLVVKSKSSTSCVCAAVGDCEIEKGDDVIYAYVPLKDSGEPENTVLDEGPLEKDPAQAILLPEKPPEELSYKEQLRGSLAGSSYHLLNSDREDRHQFMARLALNAQHINESRYSFDTYLTYRQLLEDNASNNLPENHYFRVYNLNVRMDATPSPAFTLGRAINPKASSLGAIDGLQAEKYLGNAFLGAIIGFRPDILDYGFNREQLQYGGYVGLITEGSDSRSETTLGFMEQRGRADIDRRYAYLQHSSNLWTDLNLFAVAELDLFSKVAYTTSIDPRLTNLYVSARYRVSRKFNLALSYDSRKQILYYETFQSEIERLLDEDLARQGLRARLNLRPFKNIYAGLSYAKRFQSDNQNSSNNIHGFITFSRLPATGGRASLSYNRNTSNYLESNIGSFRYSRDLVENKLYGDLYYRFVHYQYNNLRDPLEQHYMGTNLTYHINRNLLLSISGEYTTYNEENNYRIYTRIVQRINSQ